MPASEYIKTHPAYRYADAIVSGNVDEMTLIPEVAAIYKAPAYVIKQCADFLKVANGDDPEYVISEHKCRQIDGLLKLLIMPRGLQFGKTCMTAQSVISGCFMLQSWQRSQGRTQKKDDTSGPC